MDMIDSTQMLPKGTMLNGRYQVMDYLASGGFGNTYRAIDTNIGSEVAVKEFFMKEGAHRAADGCTVVPNSGYDKHGTSYKVIFDHYRRKFNTEVERIAKLKSNHIVRVTDRFQTNGTSYYVMDLINGQSLAKRIEMSGALSEQQALDIVRQLVDALEVVHKAGLYHLDIKPDNVMLTADGEAVLIDFGASKQSDKDDGITQHSMMVMTPGYAPHEQVNQEAKKVGPWTDFYALGATLYAMLTAKRPPSSTAITDDGSEAFRFPQAVSGQAMQAVITMMQVSIKKRPQNVNEVRALLPKDKPLMVELEEVKTVNDNSHSATVRLGYGERSKPAVSKPKQKKTNAKVWPVVAFLLLMIAAVIIFLPKGCEITSPESSPDAASHESLPNASVRAIPDATMSGNIYTVGGVEFTMIDVDGGSFDMGSNSGDGDEKPVHRVTLDGFSIGQTEVTQALWKAVMGDNPSHFKGDNLPVDNVSWDDCQIFIRKLNEMTKSQRPEGREFRLPTEAEWEFAARGGNKSNHTEYSGNGVLSFVGWYYANSGDSWIDGSQWSNDRLNSNNCRTHPVAQKAPNELGLYDITGNVVEWCYDWYDENYYSKSPSTNPRNDVKAPSYLRDSWHGGVEFCRVYRGGSWANLSSNCRVTNRDGDMPGISYFHLGLRLAL